MNFPTLVYKCPGDHHRTGGTYAYRGVSEQPQLDAALSEGWFLTLPEAISGKADEPADDSAPTREELALKAMELGIKFDGRTTDKALSDKIDAALAEQAGE